MMNTLFKSDKRPRDFDLIVLGGSLEGLACAKEAAFLGASVAVVANQNESELFVREQRFLNLLCDAGKQRSCLQECKNYTWDFPECVLKPLSFLRLCEAKKLLKKIARDRVEQFIDKKRVTYLEEPYSCVSPYPITISGTDPENALTAEYMVIAPIGHYQFPDIRGAKYGMLINDLMQLENIEGNILVVGNGNDALELSAALLQMGVQTSLMIHNGILTCFDSQMTSLYVNSLVDKGLTAFLQTIIKSLEKLESGAIKVNYVSLSKTWNGSSEFDNVVFVDQPVANLKPYMFQNIKLKKAFSNILVDKNFETNVKQIFAIGPAAKYQTFHCGVGTKIGQKLAQYLFKCRKMTIVEYSDKVGLLRGPVVDYAFVGLSESTAIDMYGYDNVEVYHASFKPIEFGIAQKPYMYCYLKVICLREQPTTIFGMHLSGPHAGVIIQGYAAAMRCGLTFEKLTKMTAVFPTVSREFTLLKVTKRSAVELQLQSCCS